MSSANATTTRRLSAIQRHVAAPSAGVAVSTAPATMRELEDERARASFLVREMTHFLDGGADRTAYRDEAQALLAKYPEFITADEYGLSQAQQREAVLLKVRRLYELFMEHGGNADKRNAIAEIVGIYDLTMWVRNGVHFGLFMGAIMGQGDKEQHDAWLVPLMTLQIFGSFAMTELGHGSHTRGLETTATFDAETDEFVIHTPTDTATKWWIGAAGQTATHTVVYAQLLINGEHKGLQSFVVQLRDPATHAPLPGVRIGDCGGKLGLHGVDNGWIQFDHVRIPRFHMLRRYASVSRTGEFTMHAKPQMAYSALIGTRGKLITLSAGILKKALTIAVRYCGVRRQGDQVSVSATHAQTKLLDYQSHQHRLMPLLAKAYAYHLQTSYIEGLITQFDQEGGDMDIGILADIHGTMAGLKAFSTWDILAAIEECRQSCGGMGYAADSALAKVLTDFSVIVTFEGDNTVMAQQTGSYALKAVDTMKSGQPLAGSVRYLVDATETTWQKVRAPADALLLDNLASAIRFYASRQVLSLAARMADMQKQYATREEAWSQCQVDAIETARVHVFYNVAMRFIQEVQTLQRTAQNDHKRAPLVPVLEALCQLFVLYEFDRSACGFFLRHSFMTAPQCAWIRAHVIALCERVRRDAVPLVDAFNLQDHILNSTIGRADGNVYQSILEVATKSSGQRAPYFEKHIQPMLEGELLEEVE
jgi:acyl-CoA oxidase